MLAVASSPSSMLYTDRDALSNCLELLSTHPDLAERLRVRSLALYILSYLPIKDVSGLLGIPMTNKRRTHGAQLRLGFKIPPNEPRFAEELPRQRLQEIVSTILGLSWKPWIVPMENELSQMRGIFDDPAPATWNGFNQGLPHLKYYVSATAQALRFLEDLPPDHRAQLRHLLVYEDRKSVALPECHVQGLLPYLRAIPNLRVERRIAMWEAV